MHRINDTSAHRENYGYKSSLNPNVWNNTPTQNTNGGKRAYDGKKLVNLSSHTLDSAESTILKKGLNFVVAPKTIPVEFIICNIEDSIRNLNTVHQETIRQECAVVLRKSKPP